MFIDLPVIIVLVVIVVALIAVYEYKDSRSERLIIQLQSSLKIRDELIEIMLQEIAILRKNQTLKK